MSDTNNKWNNIRIALVVFFCVFGLVTCHGIENYQAVRIKELDAEKARSDADAARAQLELEHLKNRQSE